MLFWLAVMLIPVIGLVGWLIWWASMRRGLWITIATVIASAVIGWWRGPVWIWAVVSGAVLVSLIAGALPPLDNSWWTRHKEARAAGRRDGAYYILPGLIALASIAPLLLVTVATLLPEETFPTATVDGIVWLSPEQPVAAIDIEVAFAGGISGEPATLGIDQSRSFRYAWGIRGELARTLVFPLKDGIATEAVPVVDDASNAYIGLASCDDCRHLYRIVYTLDPTYPQPVSVNYEAEFSWGDGGGPPDLDAEDLPSVRMTATAPDVRPYRITSGSVRDETEWTVERPFDLRMVTVNIDRSLVPPSGLDAWPAVERRSISTIRNPDQGNAPVVAIDDVKELDPSCHAPACLQYSYIVPILDLPERPAADKLDFEVIHWIDYLDHSGADRVGSLHVDSAAPSAWLARSTSGEVSIDSADVHIVTIDFDVGPASAAGIGAGIATLTVLAPPGVDVNGVPYAAEKSHPFSLVGCEASPPCSVSLFVEGNSGDVVAWTLDVAYGFFNVQDVPREADISFASPNVDVRD